MKVYKDFDLSKVLWYKIGGKARFLLEVNSQESILKAIDFIEKNHIKKFFVIGMGTNLIFSDEYFDGAIIRITKGEKRSIHLLKNGKIESFAGETLGDAINFAFNHNLTGLEWAGGLPGTVGAAVRGNAGAFGGQIKDVLYEAEIITMLNDGFNIVKLNNLELDFSYRNSLVKKNKNLIVSSVVFSLKRGNNVEVEKARETCDFNINYRKNNHPLEYASCGSVFKNITDKNEIERVLKAFPEAKEMVDSKWHGKVSSAYLIEKLGFSGFQKGGAKVSEKHNNFIVNLGDAKFSDVTGIIDAIQEKFYITFGFKLKVEVEIAR